MKRQALLALAVLAAPAHGEVIDASDSAFQVKNVYHVSASAAKVYAAFSQIGHWWAADHTWSGKAANLSLHAHAGGCFCEKLADGGSVQHMVVIFAQPDKLLRLSGGLGPLQSGAVNGSMSWALAEKAGATDLTVSYNVSGYLPGGLAAVAPGVETVLNQQMLRLKHFAETGKPQ